MNDTLRIIAAMAIFLLLVLAYMRPAIRSYIERRKMNITNIRRVQKELNRLAKLESSSEDRKWLRHMNTHLLKGEKKRFCKYCK